MKNPIKLKFDTTFKTQIEILPRLTIVYREVISIEWLWFCLFLQFGKTTDNVYPVAFEKKLQIEELNTIVRLPTGMPFSSIDDKAAIQLTHIIKPFLIKEQITKHHGSYTPGNYLVTLKVIKP
jgi:hypothetical protein